MNKFYAKDRWWLYTCLLVVVFHLWLAVSLQQLVRTMLAEKASLFLASLVSSAEQTLQASHYLEERVVASLKRIAVEIDAVSPETLTGEWLATVRSKYDLKTISIYDCHGRVKVSDDPDLVNTEMPMEYGCHDVLHGKTTEHVFGFSEGIFCEADAFGIATRLRNGDVLRLLTGVDFVLGYEKNVGLVSLITRFRQHPGVKRLDLVNNAGESLLGKAAAASETALVSGEFAASRPFVLHGTSQGRFEVSLTDKALSDLQRTGFLAIFASCCFALLGVKLLDGRLRRQAESLEEQRQIEETRRRIDGLGKVVAAVAHEVRNPLNTLSLALNALRADLTEGRHFAAVEPRLALLDQTVGQADQMVKNLLQASRPILPQKRLLPLPDYLHRIADTFKNTFTCRVEVICAVACDLYADPDQVQRLLWNLLLNAHQAGADYINMTVRLDISGITIEAGNNGPEIPGEVYANIFVPGNTSRPDGSGMGLYNCQRIMAAHDGTIHAINDQGMTRFVMFFPSSTGG